jgi:hypothetical protein
VHKRVNDTTTNDKRRSLGMACVVLMGVVGMDAVAIEVSVIHLVVDPGTDCFLLRSLGGDILICVLHFLSSFHSLAVFLFHLICLFIQVMMRMKSKKWYQNGGHLVWRDTRRWWRRRCSEKKATCLFLLNPEAQCGDSLITSLFRRRYFTRGKTA